jgi:hypothetical protein
MRFYREDKADVNHRTPTAEVLNLRRNANAALKRTVGTS